MYFLSDCAPSITFEESFKYCREILGLCGECVEGEPLIVRKKAPPAGGEGKSYYQQKLNKLVGFSEPKAEAEPKAGAPEKPELGGEVTEAPGKEAEDSPGNTEGTVQAKAEEGAETPGDSS